MVLTPNFSSLPKVLYNPKAVIAHAAWLDQACAHCPIFPTAAFRRSPGRVSVPMWLVILSNQLKIVALVSHYLTNKLILHRLIHWQEPKPPLLHRDYAVLIRVSSSYPPPLGRFLCITHPSATLLVSEDTFSFDLHVWGLPPAFNLSHDQTLQINCYLPKKVEIFFHQKMDFFWALTRVTKLFSIRSAPSLWGNHQV